MLKANYHGKTGPTQVKSLLLNKTDLERDIDPKKVDRSTKKKNVINIENSNALKVNPKPVHGKEMKKQRKPNGAPNLHQISILEGQELLKKNETLKNYIENEELRESTQGRDQYPEATHVDNMNNS